MQVAKLSRPPDPPYEAPNEGELTRVPAPISAPRPLVEIVPLIVIASTADMFTAGAYSLYVDTHAQQTTLRRHTGIRLLIST